MDEEQKIKWLAHLNQFPTVTQEELDYLSKMFDWNDEDRKNFMWDKSIVEEE